MVKVDPNGDLRTARYQLDEAERLFNAGLKALSRGMKTVEALRGQLGQIERDNLPPSAAIPTEHRRQHRAGREAKIDSDPALKAFILARLDAMTYEDLAQAVAKHFPPDRRVGKSAIHAWNKKRLNRSNPS